MNWLLIVTVLSLLVCTAAITNAVCVYLEHCGLAKLANANQLEGQSDEA
jgi:hypothetical protein